MAMDEHKSLKEIDQDLAEKAEQLEKEIEAAEAKHPSADEPVHSDTDSHLQQGIRGPATPG